jgi:DNA-binding transcriptional regulator YdaS (Cro superfamily)
MPSIECPRDKQENCPKGIDFEYPWDKMVGIMELKDWLAAERGRATQLAAHLKVPPSFVSRMAAAQKPVPLDHCPHIQAFTEGAVTCEELRPDAADYFALIRRQAANEHVCVCINNNSRGATAGEG